MDVGETVVWMRVDEQTGKRLSDLVKICEVRTFVGKPIYRVQIIRTGEIAQAFSDELFRVKR